MKKQNNRFRNGNNNNNGYTLNYKFDSVSIAGKISGTALDLIRRYNDLAKEAQSSGDYVDMEIYRQYAEHYRKIVTDINERRQSRYDNQSKTGDQTAAEAESESQSQEPTDNMVEAKSEPVEAVSAPNGYVETLPATEPVKSFQVVEIKEEPSSEEKPKAKRVYRRRTPANKQVAEA
ncbi:MAG: DUF4167 domain-containing protein [Alphaproteobacteria bacterium]|nr:DUF4167 domain-containing protein [Alphaproteobacteria bacterium]